MINFKIILSVITKQMKYQKVKRTNRNLQNKYFGGLKIIKNKDIIKNKTLTDNFTYNKENINLNLQNIR